MQILQIFVLCPENMNETQNIAMTTIDTILDVVREQSAKIENISNEKNVLIQSQWRSSSLKKTE